VSSETYVSPLNIGKSGTSGSPITITVSGGGTATIDVGNGTAPAININGNSYVSVDGAYGNAVGGNTVYGIKVINIGASSYCGYEYNSGHHYRFLHIDCSGSTPGSAQPDDNRGGFLLKATGNGGVEVAFNWVHGPAFPQYSNKKWGATGVTLWASTGTSNFNDSLVHDNRVDQLYNDGIRCGSNCSVYNNEVSHIDGSGHSDSLLIQSGSYSAVFNNYVHDSGDQNIYLDNLYDSTCAHIRVYNNVVASAPGFGVVIDPEGAAGQGTAASGCTTGSSAAWNDVLILNNTFAQTSAASIRWSQRGTVTNLVFKNNIFGNISDGGYQNVDLGAANTFADANAWDYNVYATTSPSYPTIAAWKASMTLSQMRAQSPSRETNGKTGNSSYVNAGANDFHLSASDTVATGAGLNLASTYAFLATDKDGNPRPPSGGAAWDLGAYVAGGGNAPDAPSGLSANAH